MRTGHSGTLVRLLVCSGEELQAHADQAQARADMRDLAAAGIAPAHERDGRGASQVAVRMRELLPDVCSRMLAYADVC
jgi:hypothetical protein